MPRLFSAIKAINYKIIDAQASLILLLFYFTLFAPVAIFVRLTKDYLNIKIDHNSFWFDKTTDNSESLEKLRNQY